MSFAPTQHERELADALGSSLGDDVNDARLISAEIQVVLATYRERIVRPIVEACLAKVDPDDVGSRHEMVLSRERAWAIVKTARGAK